MKKKKTISSFLPFSRSFGYFFLLILFLAIIFWTVTARAAEVPKGGDLASENIVAGSEVWRGI
ncbi:MAG: hypothetical protein JSW39_28715 [Desulfobacterales bacterium]|nr:MAG: hypothetical protein JSW39_28715 [Desulfobacterales bacterium]